MRRLFFLALILLPSLTAAQTCGTTDLRKTLSPAQQSAIDSALQGQPYTTGNHWIATRGADTLHLIGTVHIHDPRLRPIAARLETIIARADRLLVEATPDAEAKLQAHLAQNPDLIRISGPSLIDRLPPDEWQALADAALARGIPPFMAAQMQPWFLMISLAIAPCVLPVATSGEPGLDALLMDQATAAGTPIEALEPWTTLIDIMGSDPLDQQIEVLRLGVLPDGLDNDLMATLMAQYFEEAHMEVFVLNRVIAKDALGLDDATLDPVFDRMLDGLLYQRNRNWLPALLEARGTTVVAVGAGHLGGTGGLLDLLAREGFTLERAPF